MVLYQSVRPSRRGGGVVGGGGEERSVRTVEPNNINIAKAQQHFPPSYFALHVHIKAKNCDRVKDKNRPSFQGRKLKRKK